jgi:hypothetical protein
MALYLVRAKPKKELSDLYKELDSGKISKLNSFVGTLQHSLENVRMDKEDGYALRVEEDYCSPPLAMERESMLNTSNRIWLCVSTIDILQGNNITYRHGSNTLYQMWFRAQSIFLLSSLPRAFNFCMYLM